MITVAPRRRFPRRKLHADHDRLITVVDGLRSLRGSRSTLIMTD
jgi:hypothetical protein